MPGTTFTRNPLQVKESDQAASGLLTGVLELPKSLLLDLPAGAMRLFDYATDQPPAVSQNEPILKGLDAASKAYDDTVKSVLGTSEDTANSAPYNISATIGGFAAFPGGAEKAIAEAPSLLGKGWRALSHAINPSTLPGKVAAGTAIGTGVEYLTHPSEAHAQAGTPSAPEDLSQPVQDSLGKGWEPLGKAPVATAPTSSLGPGWKPIVAPDPIHPAITEKAQQAKDDSTWEWAALGTAAAVGLALLTKGKDAKSALELSRAANPSIFGRAIEEASPEVGLKTKIVQGQIDGGAAARDTMMKADPNLGQDFSDRMTLASPTALAEKTQTALRDGTIASTNTKMKTPLVDIANKFAGLVQKDPTIAPKFNKYAYALDAMEGANQPAGARRLVRKYDGWEKDVPQAVGLPDPQIRAAIKDHLQAHIDAIEQPRLPNGAPNPDYNPDIMQLHMSVKQNYAEMAKHLYKAGVIDRATYLDWSTRDFMPMKAQLDKGTLWTRFTKAMTLPEKEVEAHDELSSLFERKNNDGERILPPIDTQEQYIKEVIRYTEHNALRKRYVDAMKAQPAGSPLRALVSDVSNTAGVDRLLSYKVGGVTKNVQIHDPHVYNALKFNPGASVLPSIVNSSRQLLQKTTTGVLAPAFAPAGLAYDMWGIAALGNKVGPLGLAKIPYWTLRGMAKGIGARMAQGMSSSLKASMYADGTLPKLLGPHVTQTIIDRGSQIWRQSLLYKAQSVGAMGSARAMDDAAIGNRLSFMRKLAPRYATTNPALRSLRGLANMYTGLFQTVQESARLGYFEHLAGKQPALADVIRAGAEARRVTGDFAQAGSSKFAHAMSELFPYYNISMQSMARIAHQFKTKPLQTFTQVTLGLAMPSIASAVYSNMMGQQYRDYYWKRLTSADRASSMYLPVPGLPPQRGIFIPVMPEWRPFHAMLVNAMDALFGFQSGVIDRPESKGFDNGLDSMFNYRMYQDTMAGVSSGISTISVPPVVNAALGALGQRNVGDIATSVFPKLAPLKPDDLSAMDPDGSTRGVWMPQKVEQIIGSLAGTFGHAFLHAVVAAQQAVHGGRSVLPAVGQAAALDMTRNVPLSTTLWKLDRQIGANTPMDQYAQDTFAQMKHLADIARTDITNAGVGTRGQNYTLLQNEDQFDPAGLAFNMSRFKDPEIASIVMRAGQYERLWSASWGNNMNSVKKRIEDVRSSDKLSPVQQRHALNSLYAKMQDLHKEALSDIQDNFIKPLRQQYGRAIDIGKIDENSQITDFPPLAAP
jgi:hypothetical protein